jgi:hypothetical protein
MHFYQTKPKIATLIDLKSGFEVKFDRKSALN